MKFILRLIAIILQDEKFWCLRKGRYMLRQKGQNQTGKTNFNGDSIPNSASIRSDVSECNTQASTQIRIQQWGFSPSASCKENLIWYSDTATKNKEQTDNHQAQWSDLQHCHHYTSLNVKSPYVPAIEQSFIKNRLPTFDISKRFLKKISIVSSLILMTKIKCTRRKTWNC